MFTIPTQQELPRYKKCVGLTQLHEGNKVCKEIEKGNINNPKVHNYIRVLIENNKEFRDLTKLKMSLVS